jgi:hypothetical protein
MITSRDPMRCRFSAARLAKASSTAAKAMRIMRSFHHKAPRILSATAPVVRNHDFESLVPHLVQKRADD